MMTFNEEEALKKAKNDHLTPTSSAGGTTMGHSFSAATNSNQQKKKSIFSENQSISRGIHDETFAFSASKYNANCEGRPEDTPGGGGKIKNIYNKYCELRISSPRFRIHTSVSHDINLTNQLSSNLFGLDGSAKHSQNSAMKDYCE